MKSIALLLIAGSLATDPSGGSAKLSAETQQTVNAMAVQKLAGAEKEMSELLGRLRKQGSANPNAIAALDKSQTMWAQYRDAQVHALWPSSDRNEYGSVYPVCVAAAKMGMTQSRIAELNAMLESTPGNVCPSAWAQ
ncbi:MAG TPA: lysozyme inhibitor LprI family protein [Candidatus Polarisedimenticolaceae bacterium]|nr:lysozyme inhibitor LprI family protein [Candidatus Polarisedimenticolaceae bacterium]